MQLPPSLYTPCHQERKEITGKGDTIGLANHPYPSIKELYKQAP